MKSSRRGVMHTEAPESTIKGTPVCLAPEYARGSSREFKNSRAHIRFLDLGGVDGYNSMDTSMSQPHTMLAQEA